MDSGAADYPFTDEDVRAWEEPREFSDMVAAVTARAAQTRFAQLRALRPRVPPAPNSKLQLMIPYTVTPQAPKHEAGVRKPYTLKHEICTHSTLNPDPNTRHLR